jgi:hypothetical protein
MLKLTSLKFFIGDWDIDPFVGMRLTICYPDAGRKSSDCIITHIERGEIYVKRDDRECEELANAYYLQPPSEDDEFSEDDD